MNIVTNASSKFYESTISLGDGAIAKHVFLPNKSIGSSGTGSISSTKYNIKVSLAREEMTTIYEKQQR